MSYDVTWLTKRGCRPYIDRLVRSEYKLLDFSTILKKILSYHCSYPVLLCIMYRS